MIASAVFTAICYFTFPETFEPILLTQKAKKLRLKTGNQALHSKREEDPLQAMAVINRYLMKPYHMFFKEPIVCVMNRRCVGSSANFSPAGLHDRLYVHGLRPALSYLRSIPNILCLSSTLESRGCWPAIPVCGAGYWFGLHHPRYLR